MSAHEWLWVHKKMFLIDHSYHLQQLISAHERLLKKRFMSCYERFLICKYLKYHKIAHERSWALLKNENAHRTIMKRRWRRVHAYERLWALISEFWCFEINQKRLWVVMIVCRRLWDGRFMSDSWALQWALISAFKRSWAFMSVSWAFWIIEILPKIPICRHF